MPRPRRPTQFPSGPKFLHSERKPLSVGGPGEPPAGFLNGNNSREEWPPYWALLKILGPPIYGSWEYQGNVLGGRKRIGGSVPDFVITNQNPAIIVRVQTDYFHVNAPWTKRARDLASRRSMEGAGYKVVDIYSQHYMIDDLGFLTGQAVIAVMYDALRGVERPSPITTRTSTSRA